MWINSVFALVFLGFLATTGTGAASVTMLAVPRLRGVARFSLAATLLVAIALWSVVAARVDFAGQHAWSAVGAFALTMACAASLGGAAVMASRQKSRSSLAIAIVLGVVVWLVLGAVLGFGVACSLDSSCDL